MSRTSGAPERPDRSQNVDRHGPSQSPDQQPSWLRWEGDEPPAGSVDASPGVDHADETTGPWLQHDLDADATAAGERSSWLDQDLTVAPSRRPAEAAEDTGVPPTLAVDSPVDPPVDAAVDAAHRGRTRRARRTGTDEPDGSPRRTRHDDEPTGGLAVLGAAVKEFAIVVGMALVLSFVVKTWLLQAFYIPSGSMEDTLRIDDRVIVSKLTPGPIDLERGDIIVFGDPGDWVDPVVQPPRGKVANALRDTLMFVGLLPDDAENHLIKRVIGLPGDRVVCCDEGGRLTVNGAPIKEPYLKPGVAPSDQDFDIVVPRGRVWVMGDNRSGSADSRAHDDPANPGQLGSVDERLIVGRAVALVWPLDHLRWLSNPSSTFRNVPAPRAGVVDQGPGESPSTPPSGGGDVTGSGD